MKITNPKLKAGKSYYVVDTMEVTSNNTKENVDLSSDSEAILLK